MKTESLIKKTLLATLALIAITAPFMSTAKAADIFQIPPATLSMSPSRIVGNAGDTVRVDLKISNVAALFTFQAGFLFDPAKVNITASAITEGGFLSNNGADPVLRFAGSVNNTSGYVQFFSYTLQGALPGKSGSGTLLHLDFTMKVTGFSDIYIIEQRLIADDAVTLIPCNTIDIVTVVVDSTEHIVQIVGNPYDSGTVDNPHSAGFNNFTWAYQLKQIGVIDYHGLMNFTVTSQGVLTGETYDLFAYLNVTIPMTLMSDENMPGPTGPENWLFQVDGVTQGSRTVVDNGTHHTLSLQWTYPGPDGGTQKIGILSTLAVPEFPMVFLATLLVLATFAAALLGKTTLTARRKS